MMPIALAALAAFGVGFYTGDGIDSAARGVKWAVIGGAGYLAWRNRAALGRAFA